MKVLSWAFVFHPPSRMRDVIAGKDYARALCGHVEAYGFTRDDTYVFFDPQGARSTIQVTHHHDEVIELLAQKRSQADLILRVPAVAGEIRFPVLMPHLHCVTQCAALIGQRAYTIKGFKRILLGMNAEIMHATTPAKTH